MPNTLTDQYQLVRTSTVDTTFIQILTGKTVNYNDGFCRELFRDGKHLQSLRSASDSFSARKGDTVLTVNMGVITVPFTDKLPTRDGYHLTYDGTVRLAVWDARTFATCYQQSIDPLQKTLDAIRATLLREVARDQHDVVDDVRLRYLVEHNVPGAPRRPTSTPWGPRDIAVVIEYGVAILEAQTMIPHADPRRTAEIEEERRRKRQEEEEATRVARERERLAKEQAIEQARLAQQEVLQRERLRVQDELAQQQRLIDERKLREAHTDSNAQWEHERIQHEQSLRRDAALQLEIEQVRQQVAEDRALLRRLREQGFATADILREHPELDYLFERRNVLTGSLLNPEVLKSIAGGTAQAMPADDTPSADGVSEKYGVTRESHDDDHFTLAHLGIAVSRHELNAKQIEYAQTPGQSLAYFVEKVLPTGDQAQDLQKGDIIYQINDQSVPELPDAATLLDTLQAEGNPVKVTYLRGMTSLVTYIEIPSLRP